MIEITHDVAGKSRRIFVPEEPEELGEFMRWIEPLYTSPVAVDTETTGLDIFSDGYRVRTIQFGTTTEAWVIPIELGDDFREVGVSALTRLDRMIFQNAAFDVISLRQALGVSLDWDRILDTKILAHLVDPRQTSEGGPGLSLADLTRYYIDAQVADEVKDSIKTLAAEAGTTKAEVFKTIDLWNPVYLLYAGMDVILTALLSEALLPLVPVPSRGLVRIEHDLARICAEMEFNGFLLDVEYAHKFAAELEETRTHYEKVAEDLGVENVNSTDQVAAALIERGVKITERTPSGKYKVDKKLLERLVAEGDPLAEAVSEAKKAKKWRATWVQKFLDNRDPHDRCHATIQPLQARTGRMSITGIPAQTLPSGDWKVRRCFIADPGYSLVSVDYQAQELRVLAAISGDQNMQEAFATGADLHQMTADASGVDRSVGKTVNFAYVYGSGPKNIAETCGISVEKAREVIEGFERTYPGVKRLSDKLQRQARQFGYVQTGSGRRIPVDQQRPYAALNYVIQSTSRDITAAALLRLDQAGLTKYLRLPIHDEVLACVPSDQAEEYAEQIAELMKTDYMGVLIDTDAEVTGPSWGHAYAPDEIKDQI